MSNVLTYLEKTATRLPDKIAFADLVEKATYREVLERSRGLGKVLKDETGKNRPVAVLMDKSVACVTLFFGIIYAGGCYSMVDPKHPLVRIDQILEILDPMILVTDREHLEMCDSFQFVKNGGKVLVLEDLMEAVKHLDRADQSGECEGVDRAERIGKSEEVDGTDRIGESEGVDRMVHCEDKTRKEAHPLYINFTSGSTGVPKGVCVGHDSVVKFIDSFVDICGITENDMIGNQAPFDFDVSVKDIYATICVGATMHIIPKKYFSFPTMLLDYLCERKITTLIWAVSALCIVTTVQGFDYKIPGDVRKVVFSGEIMPLKHLNQWMEVLPDAKFFNVYGPTEITCNCTYYEVPTGKPVEELLPIGKAFPGEDVFLLDTEEETQEKKQLCVQKDRVGKIGELCVGGERLALGYYRNPLQTGKSFVSDPRMGMREDMTGGDETSFLREKEKFLFLENTEGVIYKTGDLAYYMEDGNLMFVGRKDFQIKHMGHRIELSEIELALDRLPGMVRSCVLYQQEKQQIVAFYEGELKRKDIMKGLKNELPAFMVPNKFVQMERLPLSKNGKIDRKLLGEQLQ